MATVDVGRYVAECDGVFVRIGPRGSIGTGVAPLVELDGEDLARICDLAEVRGLQAQTLAVQRAEDRADDYDRLYRGVCFDADTLREERTELRRQVLEVLRPLVEVSKAADALVVKLEGAIKAGHAQWRQLLLTRPETYARWEAEEAAFRADIRDTATILTDRRGGERRPITLAEFRRRIEAEDTGQLELDDWGTCGCAI